MDPRQPLAVTILTAMLLAGCASSASEYPSLAIRDAERMAAEAPAAPEPTPAPPISAAVLSQVADAVARANAAHSDFMAFEPVASRRVAAARGAGIASDRWSEAQVSLSQLDSLRSKTAVAMGELDMLYAARAVELERRDAIADARTEVAALLRRQDEALSALKPVLPQ